MSRSRDTANTQENVGGSVAPFVAGKNAIINGDFRINQRNFTSVTSGFNFDRWQTSTNDGSMVVTCTPQTFTPGTAPVAGYEGSTYLRTITTNSSGGGIQLLFTRLEDCRLFAGQTVTVSYWAKAGSGTPKTAVTLNQNFGSGGSTQVSTNSSVQTLSTSWTRYSYTISVPSISGKTIGTSSYFEVVIPLSSYPIFGTQNATIDIWGVQLEAGSVATPFTTATGTIQGELAACQRYYVRTTASANNAQTPFGYGYFYSSTGTVIIIKPPVTMRTVPSFTFSYCGLTNTSGGNMVLSGSPSNYYSTADVVQVTQTSATSQTTGQFTTLAGSNASSGTGYVELSAEL